MSAFEKAFASARKEGKKEFSFGGKSYNTKMKSEGKKSSKSFAKTPEKAPVPTSRPKGGEMYSKSMPALKGNVGGMKAAPKQDRLPATGLAARMAGDKPNNLAARMAGDKPKDTMSETNKLKAAFPNAKLGTPVKEKKAGGALSVGKPVVGTGKRVSGLGGPVGTGGKVVGSKKKK